MYPLLCGIFHQRVDSLRESTSSLATDSGFASVYQPGNEVRWEIVKALRTYSVKCVCISAVWDLVTGSW